MVIIRCKTLSPSLRWRKLMKYFGRNRFTRIKKSRHDCHDRTKKTRPVEDRPGTCQRRQTLQDSRSAHEEAPVPAGCAHRGAAQGAGTVRLSRRRFAAVRFLQTQTAAQPSL